jgi:hypothetical protein
MNKLNLTGLGGHPFTSDDLEYLQNAYTEALRGIMSLSKNNSTLYDIVIWWGCIITETPTTFTYTEGYASINGEMYYVPAQSTPQTKFGAGQFCFGVNEVNEVAGTVTYEDATIKNTWKQRRAEIIWSNISFFAIDASSYLNYHIRNIVDSGTGWTIPTVGLNFSLTPFSAPGKLQYRVDPFGYLNFKGRVASTNTGSQIVFTLPTIANPGRDIHLALPCYDNTVPINNTSTVYGLLSSSGAIQILNGMPSNNHYIDFNNLRIKI